VQQLPAGYATNSSSYVTNAGYLYRLYTVQYLVSSTPFKPAQKMYWTEGSFEGGGHPIDVSAGQVSAVHVVYSTDFPMTVTNSYQDPNYVPPVNPTNMFQELRTLWFDTTRNQVLAYNIEGQVFIELLGELIPENGTRRYLGCEIVNVYKQPVPQAVTVELGDRVPAYPDANQDDSALFPSPVIVPGPSFYYQQVLDANGHSTLYATRETFNPNDFLAYWLIEGTAGLRWPYLFDRYTEVWPNDAAEYSHYVRPLVATDAQAQATAVPLPAAEAPAIAYQDDPDHPRAKLTAADDFYTFLLPPYTTHRTLLQFNLGDQVAFERVMSWLDTAVLSPAQCAGSVATNLTAWDSINQVFHFPTNGFGLASAAPCVVSSSVNVGDRILAPAGELGAAGTDYWAGYILQTNGTSFNPGAYIDPFAFGFDQAAQGSIIPVNAIPGRNLLEVWWFRQNNADAAHGFEYLYWPAVIGRYTLQWPTNAPQIVLASNDGTGPLDSLRAAGSIYYQNDPKQPGYNPNEDHARRPGLCLAR